MFKLSSIRRIHPHGLGDKSWLFGICNVDLQLAAVSLHSSYNDVLLNVNCVVPCVKRIPPNDYRFVQNQYTDVLPLIFFGQTLTYRSLLSICKCSFLFRHEITVLVFG